MSRVESLAAKKFRAECTAARFLGLLAPAATVQAMDFTPPAVNIINRWRYTLPLPIDPANHINNVIPSCVFGVYVGAIATTVMEQNLVGPSPNRLRGRVAAVGLVAGAVLNGLTESKWGTRVFHSSPPEFYDFVWGTAAATIAAAAVPQIVEQNPQLSI